MSDPYCYTDDLNILKDEDCQDCFYFGTQPIMFPSGFCYLDEGDRKSCGVGYTCDEFKRRVRLSDAVDVIEIDFEKILRGESESRRFIINCCDIPKVSKILLEKGFDLDE